MNSDLLRDRPMRIMYMYLEGAFVPYISVVDYIFITNLDKITDYKFLYDVFSTFGNILSCKIMTDENRQSKGFGFVCLSAPNEATKTVTEMNGSIVGSKPLYVALAQRKEESRMNLTNQHVQLPFHNRMMSYLPTPRWTGACVGRFTNSTVISGLDNATAQKQMLRERLFPLIQQIQPDLAGKITDMLLLEIDNTELCHMLDSRESLKAKVCSFRTTNFFFSPSLFRLKKLLQYFKLIKLQQILLLYKTKQKRINKLMYFSFHSMETSGYNMQHIRTLDLVSYLNFINHSSK